MSQTNSRAALAAKMRGQGAAFKTKVLVNKAAGSGTRTGTGSHTQAEGGSETSGSRVAKQKVREGEGSEELNVGVKVCEIAAETQKKKKKKRKTGHSGQDAAVDVEIPVVEAPDTEMISVAGVCVPGEDSVPDVPDNTMVYGTGAGGPDGVGDSAAVIVQGAGIPHASAPKEKKIGSKTLGELAGMAASIADDKEWEKLKDNTLADTYRGRLALWAQDAMLIAADRRLIASYREQMKEMSRDITQRDNLVAALREEVKEGQRGIALRVRANELLQEANKKLQDQVDEFNAHLHTAGEKLKHAEYRENELKVRVEEAEKKFEDQQGRVVELETELGARRPEKEVIQTYKASAEYTDALLGEVAKELGKCWEVTKELTQTNPDHSYDEFCDVFFAEEPETKEQESPPPSGPVTNPPEVQVEDPVDPDGGRVPDNAGIPEVENQENQETPDAGRREGL